MRRGVSPFAGTVGRRSYGGYLDVALIVSTERLGFLGDDASWVERKGYVQRSPSYENHPDQPTATCHLQEGPEVNALCGYQWESLSPVPGATSLAEIPDSLRCSKCWMAAG
jgi:hypothetical protein